MNTQEDLIRLILAEFGYTVDMETKFEDIDDFDSLRIVEMVMRVEEEYDIEIADEDMDNIHTVRDLYNLISDYS